MEHFLCVCHKSSHAFVSSFCLFATIKEVGAVGCAFAIRITDAKKPGPNIIRYFGDPAVSVRPNRLSVPSSRKV